MLTAIMHPAITTDKEKSKKSGLQVAAVTQIAVKKRLEELLLCPSSMVLNFKRQPLIMTSQNSFSQCRALLTCHAELFNLRSQGAKKNDKNHWEMLNCSINFDAWWNLLFFCLFVSFPLRSRCLKLNRNHIAHKIISLWHLELKEN